MGDFSLFTKLKMNLKVNIYECGRHKQKYNCAASNPVCAKKSKSYNNIYWYEKNIV